MAAVAAVVLIAGVGLQPGMALSGKAAPHAPDLWIGLALIMLGVLIVGSVVWLALPGHSAPGILNGEASEARGIDDPTDVSTFRVVALGLSGAGKTTLLATQFNAFSDLGNRGYFFDGDFEQDNNLAKIFDELRDTQKPWPTGTHRGDTREYRFDCKVRDPAIGERTVFGLSYLDYAGELLEAGDEHAAKGKMETQAKNAHALLLVLDGRQVLGLLCGDDEAVDYFDRRMRPLFGLARRASCPVQLIITKWDHVQSWTEAPQTEDQLLKTVGRRLMERGHIELLVEAPDHRQRPVRLIPVSAVGRSFADPDEHGKMVKRQGGTIEPIHIDIPLSAVLPDVLQHAEQELDRVLSDNAHADFRRTLLNNAAMVTAPVLDSRAGRVLRSALVARIGEEAVRLFIEMLGAGASKRSQAALEDHEAQTRRLRAEVVDHMRLVMLSFERDLSSSNLRR